MLSGNGLELRSRALPWALALGILADALVRAPGRPGLNVALWALGGVAVLVLLSRRRSEAIGAESWGLVGAALAFAVALVWRDAQALAAFGLSTAVALLLLAAGRAGAMWVAQAQPSQVAIGVLRVGLLCLAGPIGWGPGAPETGRPDHWKRRTRTLARGVAMALPPLLVLAALLMSADPLFSRLVHDVFAIDLEALVEHLVVTVAIAWLACGYLRAFMVRDEVFLASLRVPQPALAEAEVTVALWVLNLLFGAFMAVQVRYLFGGANLVEVTPGLSYAEYARRGFFELVAAATLVVPILLAADWAVAPQPVRKRLLLRATMLVLVVLLAGVIASAAYRMWLYQVAYGLTEQRLYVSAFIAWLTFVLGWLVFTVLRGRRARFSFGVIVGGAACVAALHVLNPHALIARVNLDRAAVGAQHDLSYVAGLGADAVPAVLSRLGRLRPTEQCYLVAMLSNRWLGERRGGWRTWNLADWRARESVAKLEKPICAVSK